MDVGGFNLSEWTTRFADFGVVSVDELKPLGRLTDARRRKLLLDLLNPHTISTLHLVSLSLSIADLL